jgi:hypothetical protein
MDRSFEDRPVVSIPDSDAAAGERTFAERSRLHLDPTRSSSSQRICPVTMRVNHAIAVETGAASTFTDDLLYVREVFTLRRASDMHPAG